MKTAEDIALLAPVPSSILDSATKMPGRVAFGSNAYALFLKLEELRGKDDIDVYIYASHAGGMRDAEVSWYARYVGFVRSESGFHPNPKHRPESTLTDTEAALFWEVEDLKRLPQPIWIGKLKGLGRKNKPYGHNFPPRGPVLIDHP